MELNAEKGKIMVTGSGRQDHIIREEITVNCEKLEQTKQFKYLGSIITETVNLRITELLARMGAATNALIKLDKIWEEKKLKLGVNF